LRRFCAAIPDGLDKFSHVISVTVPRMFCGRITPSLKLQRLLPPIGAGGRSCCRSNFSTFPVNWRDFSSSFLLRIFEQSRNRWSKTAGDNRAQMRYDPFNI
jgi:hypothetical protein